MMGVWKLNKSMDIGAYKIEFRTLFVDKRDMMSDAVRPEMGVSDSEKNRRVEVLKDSMSIPEWAEVCSRERGNDLYREFSLMAKSCCGEEMVRAWVEERKAS